MFLVTGEENSREGDDTGTAVRSAAAVVALGVVVVVGLLGVRKAEEEEEEVGAKITQCGREIDPPGDVFPRLKTEAIQDQIEQIDR